MKTAIITLTRGSVQLGLSLYERMDEADLYVPLKHKGLTGGKRVVFEELDQLVEEIFSKYKGLIFIMASGIVVRKIAHLIKGKDVDPAVVVMDEAGRFAISLLSGHLGGANELAEKTANLVGATPVITTATDVCNKSCAEDVAKDLECEIENVLGIKRVNSAFLHDEPVAINLPAGKKGRFAGSGNFIFCETLEELVRSNAACIAITNRLLPEIMEACLVFRPKNLVVGIGCNRNTSAEEIEDVVFKALADAGLSQKSIRNLASIDVKRDEAGLLAFAGEKGFTIDFFAKDELQKAELKTAPSMYVMEAVGVGGVCEPAAMLSARTSKLLVAKIKSSNVTVAVAEVV